MFYGKLGSVQPSQGYRLSSPLESTNPNDRGPNTFDKGIPLRLRKPNCWAEITEFHFAFRVISARKLGSESRHVARLNALSPILF